MGEKVKGWLGGGLGLRWQGLCGLGRQRFDLLRGCWRWLGFVLTRGTAGRLVAEPVQVGKGVPSGVVHEVAFYLVVLVAEAAPGGQESRDAGAEGVAAKLLIPTLPEALVLEGYDVNLEFVAKLLGVKQELLAAGCRTCYARRATSFRAAEIASNLREEKLVIVGDLVYLRTFLKLHRVLRSVWPRARNPTPQEIKVIVVVLWRNLARSLCLPEASPRGAFYDRSVLSAEVFTLVCTHLQH